MCGNLSCISIELFKNFLRPESHFRILNIHTQGIGGVGKTRLVLRLQEYCAFIPDEVVFTKELIDFYHTESRSKIGVMRQITDYLGTENFSKFTNLVKKYDETPDVGAREYLLPKLEDTFQKEYHAFAIRAKTGQKWIAIFFDTYEFIQQVHEDRNGADSTEFSQWVETKLFQYIAENTRVVVSGRYPLRSIDHSQSPVQEVLLPHFELSETITFWQGCFNTQTVAELDRKIGSHELLETFHRLSNGRPILLALFADWINYSRKPLSPQELLTTITQETSAITGTVTPEQQGLLEKALIERIAALIKPEDRAVTYMAVAYHRMTPEMFQFLTKFPLEECRNILLEKLKPLSFVKYKAQDIVLLHDEMRRMIVDLWWKYHDPERSLRQGIAQKIVAYYDTVLLADQDLSEIERETYTAELLEYTFQISPKLGVERFCREFDTALEDAQYITTSNKELSYDYCDILLRVAERYHRENPDDVPFPAFLHIERRRIHYTTIARNRYDRSLQQAITVLETYTGEWEQSELCGYFWWERGIAEFSLERFEEAVNSYKKALDIFYQTGSDDLMTWVNNSLGYAYYRQGQFQKAEISLNLSLDGFYNLLEKENPLSFRQRRQIFQGLQFSFGNLAIVYGYTGRFAEAVLKAQTALNIVRNLPFNALEIARSRATVGRTTVLIGHMFDARHQLQEAAKILHNTENRLIESRIKTDLSYLHYRVNEFAYFLEFYRAEEIETILQKNEHDQDVKKRIKEAREFLEKAIRQLLQPPIIKKELADAYYALGELWMVTPTDGHWQQAEQAFQEALKWGKESKFLYRVIDTLKSFVTLYYFWHGSSTENRDDMRRYSNEIQALDVEKYPDIFGKYALTSGNIKFDLALATLQSDEENAADSIVQYLSDAFQAYTTAAIQMKAYHSDLYYVTLRLFYNRLTTLTKIAQQKKMFHKVVDWLKDLEPLWKGKITEFQEIYTSFSLRFYPDEKMNDIKELQDTIIPTLLRGGYLGMVSLLNSCLLDAYKSLLSMEPQNNTYKEQLIRCLNFQAGIYRSLGDSYQTNACIEEAKQHIKNLAASPLKDGLEGHIICQEGALLYRSGEYGKLLEYYLWDELHTAKEKFDSQLHSDREKALKILQSCEVKLQQTLENTGDGSLHRYLRRVLGELKFRIGETLMLKQDFEDDTGEGQKGTLMYLAEAIQDAQYSEDTYRADSARGRYLHALYSAQKYHHHSQTPHEKYLEEKWTLSPEKSYPTIMGRLRIVQGDALFSSYFVRRKVPGENEYIYVPSQETANISTLRTMLRYYVEACDFMAQHSSANFAAAVRVLQRRIRLIGNKDALLVIKDGLNSVWKTQLHLRNKIEEFEILVQFTKIRSMMVDYGNNR